MVAKGSSRFWEKLSTQTLKRGSADTEYITIDFTPFGAVLSHLDTSIAGSPKIKRYAYLEMDPALTEAEKKNAYQGFLSASGNKKSPKVMLCLAEGMTCRQLSVPEMPYDDLIKAFAWELKKKYFYNPDDNHLGFMEVMEVEGIEGKEKLYDIFYCDKKTAQTQLDLIQSLGVDIESLIPSQAVLGAFAQKTEPGGEQDTLVCEVYETVARIVVVRNGKVMVSRNVILGQAGGGFTDALLEKIAQEIRVTADFYDSQKNARPIGKVLFAGGGYDVVRLHEYMSQHLTFKVVLPNVDAFISESAKKEDREFILAHPGLFSAAIGLPLVTDQTVNLVPEDIKAKNQIKKNTYILNLGLIVLSVIFLGVIGLSALNIQWMKTQLVDLKGQYDAISARRETLQSMLKDSRVRRAARKGDIPVRALLKEISLRTPALATLNEIQYNRQGGNLNISGEVMADPNRDSMKTVTQFVTVMSESPFCASAKLEGTTQDDPNILKFNIVCEIKGFS